MAAVPPVASGRGHSWSAPTSVHASPEASPSRLQTSLQTQIEFYFSPQNLASDSYLLSQMNESRYVLISVISDFKLVKKITTDIDLIVSSIRRSKLLELDATSTMVRASAKASERTTIILRDISADTPIEEIKSLFESESCAPVKSLRADIGDTWFVTFEDENSCLRTAQYLKSQSFKGKPIRLRVKSENLARSFHQETIPSRIRQSPQFFMPQPPMMAYPQQPGFIPGGRSMPMSPADMRWNLRRFPSFNAVPFWDPEGMNVVPGPMGVAIPGHMHKRFGNDRSQGEGGPRRSGKPSNRRPADPNLPAHQNGMNGSFSQRGRKPKRFPKRGEDQSQHQPFSQTTSETSPQSSPTAHQPDLGIENFPALPTTIAGKKSTSTPPSPLGQHSYVSRTAQTPATSPQRSAISNGGANVSIPGPSPPAKFSTDVDGAVDPFTNLFVTEPASIESQTTRSSSPSRSAGGDVCAPHSASVPTPHPLPSNQPSSSPTSGKSTPESSKAVDSGDEGSKPVKLKTISYASIARRAVIMNNVPLINTAIPVVVDKSSVKSSE